MYRVERNDNNFDNFVPFTIVSDNNYGVSQNSHEFVSQKG